MAPISYSDVKAIGDDLGAILKRIKNAEAERGFHDLMDKVRELYDENAETREQLERARQQLAKFEREAEIEAELTYDDDLNAYHRKQPDGLTSGPYCPRCWDVDRRLLRLNMRDDDRGQCRQCKSGVYGRKAEARGIAKQRAADDRRTQRVGSRRGWLDR